MISNRVSRIQSIDILRGLVMIIMAIDHTRDFFHVTAMTGDPLDPATTSIPLYFTRWITHFCAPIFVFLSGLSAYLASRKKTRAEASVFLIKRGLWLVLVEVLVVTLGITFNPLYNFIILQVIWAIGWSMVFLGIVSRFSFKLVLALGLVLTFGHDVLHYLTLPAEGASSVLWKAFFTANGSVVPIDQSHFLGFFYAVLPWTGVMMLGYSLGVIFQKEYPSEKRFRILLYTGLSMIGLFLLLRSLNSYGDPAERKVYPAFYQTVLSFFNASKYPPSLMYICMTIGPGLVLLALLENAKGKWTSFVSIYGKVPFFYYICHFYLLHLLLVVVFFLTGHTTSQIVDPNLPFLFRPLNFGYSLPGVYTIWLLVVLVLYRPCKWFAKYKETHNQWWLSYV
jgi:uncharacterized membrane protein